MRLFITFCMRERSIFTFVGSNSQSITLPLTPAISSKNFTLSLTSSLKSNSSSNTSSLSLKAIKESELYICDISLALIEMWFTTLLSISSLAFKDETLIIKADTGVLIS